VPAVTPTLLPATWSGKAVIVLFTLCALACSDPPTMPRCGADAGTTETAEAVFDPAVFEESAECGSAAPFFDAPFPHELRTDAEGRPDLSRFPRARGLLGDAIEILRGEGPGVSPITGVYFRFTASLDASSLPTAPGDATANTSNVWLLDLEPSSPTYGDRLPAYVRFQDEATFVIAAHTLIVRPVPGVHLHPGRRYAVVLRDGLRAADGRAVLAAPAFEVLKSGGEGELADFHTALFGELDALGISREGIVAATAFRVSDHARELDVAREYVAGVELPTPRWSVRDATTFAGELETYELMSGTPPFTEPGDGRIAFDAAGRPLAERRVTLQMVLTVPSGRAPAGGWPVVLYGHGTGGDASTHVPSEGRVLAEAGLATLGFDAAFHGARATAGVDPSMLVIQNPLAAREMVRQTVIDQMLFLRMLREQHLDVPSSVAGSEVVLAPSPVLFMGHSQGSQEAGVLLGVEPTVDAAFLSAGGGGGIITVTQDPYRCAIAAFVGEACEDLLEDHPVITLIVQPMLDAADPLSFAHRFLRERPATSAPLSIAMTEGTLDMFTPPRTIEALAVAIGLPIVEPLVQATDPYLLTGTPTVTAPIQGNLTIPSSGAAVTGGLMQWAGADHFAIYDVPDAENRYRQFFTTVIANGTPTIVGP
jgi:hypothetical protein